LGLLDLITEHPNPQHIKREMRHAAVEKRLGDELPRMEQRFTIDRQKRPERKIQRNRVAYDVLHEVDDDIETDERFDDG